jgi:hypothetical protein
MAVSAARKSADGCSLRERTSTFVRPFSVSSTGMEEPEYFICLQCEMPTYQFEFTNGKLGAILCATCGNDDPEDFITEGELEDEM